MSGAMRFVEVVKHYPGQQQVNLSVEIEVPGSWFDGTEMGSLSASERRQKYKAQAVEYAEVREFPGASARTRKVKEPSIRFLSGRRKLGPEFRRVLDAAVAVEPVPP